MQQRAGLRLEGGVGAAGDLHERHADRVAARVVQGASSEALLDPYASYAPYRSGASGPGPAAEPVLQRQPDLFPGAPLQKLVEESERRALLARLLKLAEQESRQKLRLEELRFPPSPQRASYLKQLLEAIPGFGRLPRILRDDIIDTASAYVELGVGQAGDRLSASDFVTPILRAVEKLLFEGAAPKDASSRQKAPEGAPKSDTIYPIVKLRF